MDQDEKTAISISIALFALSNVILCIAYFLLSSPSNGGTYGVSPVGFLVVVACGMACVANIVGIRYAKNYRAQVRARSDNFRNDEHHDPNLGDLLIVLNGIFPTLLIVMYILLFFRKR